VRGRRPKPAAQRRREGNPGKRPIHDGLIADGEPEKPEFSNPYAEEEWERVVPLLVSQGIAGRAHTASLMAMCIHWGIAEDARLTYESEGLVEEGSMGQMVEHPLISTYMKAIAAYLRIAVEFGLTASAATRIQQSAGEAAAPFAEIGLSPRLKAVKGGKA